MQEDHSASGTIGTPSIDETERVPDNLPDPPVGFPEASLDPRILSPSRTEDIPASSQDPAPNQPFCL